MTSRRSVASPCSDLSTNKSLSLTIGYIGEVCKNHFYLLKFLSVRKILTFGKQAMIMLYTIITILSNTIIGPSYNYYNWSVLY